MQSCGRETNSRLTEEPNREQRFLSSIQRTQSRMQPQAVGDCRARRSYAFRGIACSSCSGLDQGTVCENMKTEINCRLAMTVQCARCRRHWFVFRVDHRPTGSFPTLRRVGKSSQLVINEVDEVPVRSGNLRLFWAKRNNHCNDFVHGWRWKLLISPGAEQPLRAKSAGSRTQ